MGAAVTTYAQMLELSDPMDCHVRHLGDGSIRVLMWGSVNANPQMLVRLYGSGKLVVVDMTDLRVAHNPGDPRDGIHIPEDWQSTSYAEMVQRGFAEAMCQEKDDGNQCYVVPGLLNEGIREIALTPNELRKGRKVASRAEWLNKAPVTLHWRCIHCDYENSGYIIKPCESCERPATKDAQ